MVLAGILLATAVGIWFASKQRKPVPSFDLSQAAQVKSIVPVVVIGSGPAGLSAALYTARSAIYTVLFAGKHPGGQLASTTYVENWPGTPKMMGPQLIELNKQQAERFGAHIVQDSISEVDFSQWPYKLKTEDGQELFAMTVIIATGADPKLLNDTRDVPGEKEYWGHGVTTCAVCDAPFYKGKKVAVIGGGESAIEQATLLTSYADSVTMIVRGSRLRAAPAMQDRLKGDKKITVLYETEATEIFGDGTKVQGIKLASTSKEAKADKAAQIRTLGVDGVFLAIGHRPNTEVFKGALATDAEGYLLVSGSQKTSVRGLFAAGDVADRVYRQAGVAAGDGIKAGLDAIAFLHEIGYTDAFAASIEKNYYEPHADMVMPPLAKIKTSKDFDALSKKYANLVLEVGADNCSSCKVLMPIVQSVAARFGDRAHFAQIDLGDDPQELVKRFALKAIPTMLVVKQGKLIARYDQQSFTKRQLYGILNQLFSE